MNKKPLPKLPELQVANIYKKTTTNEQLTEQLLINYQDLDKKIDSIIEEINSEKNK